jgi:hypothetical protein
MFIYLLIGKCDAPESKEFFVLPCESYAVAEHYRKANEEAYTYMGKCEWTFTIERASVCEAIDI